jgi:hypothetical protein
MRMMTLVTLPPSVMVWSHLAVSLPSRAWPSTSAQATVPFARASTCSVTIVPGRDSSTLGAVVSTYSVTTMPGHATSTEGALAMPSSIRIPIAIVAGAVATPALILLASSMASDDPWCTAHRARVFLGIIYRGSTRPPTLQKTPRSAYSRIRQEQRSEENS